MVWKQASDCCAGTAAIYGAPDLVKVSQLFSDTDVTDTVTIHESVNWTFQSDGTTGDSIRISNPAQTFNYNIRATAIAAQRDVILPLLTGDDTLVFEAHCQTLTNKCIVASQLSGIIADARMPNLTGDVTTVEGAVATTIANCAVDTVMIGNCQVTVAKMAANSVDSDQYVDTSIDNVHLAGSISQAKMTNKPLLFLFTANSIGTVCIVTDRYTQIGLTHTIWSGTESTMQMTIDSGFRIIAHTVRVRQNGKDGNTVFFVRDDGSTLDSITFSSGTTGEIRNPCLTLDVVAGSL